MKMESNFSLIPNSEDYQGILMSVAISSVSWLNILQIPLNTCGGCTG